MSWRFWFSRLILLLSMAGVAKAQVEATAAVREAEVPAEAAAKEDTDRFPPGSYRLEAQARDSNQNVSAVQSADLDRE